MSEESLQHKWFEARRRIVEKLLSTRFNRYQATAMLSLGIIGYFLIDLLVE